MMKNPEWVLTTCKKAAALRQLDAAITHFHGGELECAITLAAAAEGILPRTENPHLFKMMMSSPVLKDIDNNMLINWLKHSSVGPECIQIHPGVAAIVIVRAISKFVAVHSQSTVRFDEFVRWGREADHLSPLHRPLPPR
jgi:hypothetical protein